MTSRWPDFDDADKAPSYSPEYVPSEPKEPPTADELRAIADEAVALATEYPNGGIIRLYTGTPADVPGARPGAFQLWIGDDLALEVDEHGFRLGEQYRVDEVARGLAQAIHGCFLEVEQCELQDSEPIEGCPDCGRDTVTATDDGPECSWCGWRE